MAVLVLGLSLAITYSVWEDAREAAMKDLRNAFDYRVRETAQRIDQRMDTYEQVLRGAQGFWHGSMQVMHNEFHAYVAALKLEEHYPGIQGLAISEIVPKAQKEQHEAAVRQLGFSDYSIHPGGEREIYTSITQIEPFSGMNLRAHGYDMFSEPVRRAAMERARDTGDAALSGKVTLVQETGENVQAGFLMYLPVFRQGMHVRTVAQRQADILGWVYAPFRMNDLMEGIGGERSSDLRLRLFDGTTMSDRTQLYDSTRMAGQRAQATPMFTAVQRITIAGHQWTLAVDSGPGFESQLDTSKLQFIVIAGISVSALLALLVWSLASGRQRALRLAMKMTHEIKESEEALRRSHEALRHAQKLEAVGKLTGGVAHDFNNVLQIIAGNLQLLQIHFAGDAIAEKRLAGALSAVDRGAKLSSQLLAFARRQPLRPRVVDLRRVLENMDDLLRQALGEAIAVETVFAGDLWNTLADPNHLENVILNLVINARDAMDGQGTLRIALGNATLDERYVSAHPDAVPGQYVLLAISDTGAGMNADVIEQAFEPFFTTKPEGQGTGLGLSMAYGFVKQSGGHIQIESEVGRGATVKIYLPRSPGIAMDMPESVPDTAAGGSETILVVEDDPGVQATVVAMLGDLGYRVIKADDGESALRVVKSGVPIDLLFTDVVMPGALRGPELAKAVREIHPDIAVLFTSGYTRDAMGTNGRLDPDVNLLSKPYRREQLASKVRESLSRKA